MTQQLHSGHLSRRNETSVSGSLMCPSQSLERALCPLRGARGPAVRPPGGVGWTPWAVSHSVGSLLCTRAWAVCPRDVGTGVDTVLQEVCARGEWPCVARDSGKVLPLGASGLASAEWQAGLTDVS